MSQPVKDAVLALFVPDEVPDEVPIPVPPSATVEIVVCPHCDSGDCEVWNSTEARMATCPDCDAEFYPPVIESKAKDAIMRVTEHRSDVSHRLLRSGHLPDELEHFFRR